MSYTFSELKLVSESKAKIFNEDCVISQISIDSRIISKPEETLFFALKGLNNNGHDFIEDLYSKGVRNFVISDVTWDLDKLTEANFIICDSVLTVLQKVAQFHRSKFNIPIVGITGSNGKTIVKEWLSEFLKIAYTIVKSPKSYNSQVGLPLSVLLLNNSHGFGIFEAGISMPDEMGLLEAILRPDYGIITNIGSAHQENFKSKEEKAQEKLKLFQHSKLLVYCKDDPIIDGIIQSERKYSSKTIFNWSATNENVDLFIQNEIESNKTIIKGIYKKKEYTIEIPFTDKASIENAVQVWAFLFAIEMIDTSVFNKFSSLTPVAMRLEQKEGINGSVLINDSYSSDIESLTIALDYLKQFKQKDFKSLVLSDLLQTGKSKEQLYAEIAELLSRHEIDKVYGIGPEISSYLKLKNIKHSFFINTRQFLDRISKDEFHNEVVLIKGARDFHFEKIINYLEKKSHQTTLEINLSALIRNVNYFKSKLHPKTKIMAMVKAFSYGSGSYEIANILQYHHADYLAVAYTNEGIELREAGIFLPIMVMNANPDNFDLMIEYNLEPEIFSMNVLDKFLLCAQRGGVKKYPVHIKVDTGMNRLGFQQKEICKLKYHLSSTDLLQVKSVFSHLSCADIEDEDEFTLEQINTFQSMVSELKEELSYPFEMHILNSSGIARFPAYQFDMVRLGIGMYGLDVEFSDELENVICLKSVVSQIKDVPIGGSVSYGRKWKAKLPSQIAIIPIGYADGLNRRLSNGLGEVQVKGKKVKLIGNICMDMCMLDVTGMDVKVGEEVIVYGEQIKVEEIAKKLDTIPYEILTSVSHRVKRIYIQE